MSPVEQQIQDIGVKLVKETLESPLVQVENCRHLVHELQTINGNHVNLSILENTKIGKLLTKAIRSFKRHQRTASEETRKEWSAVIQDASQLIDQWKATAEEEAKENAKKTSAPTYSNEPGPPKSIAEYRTRLVVQKKEIYKDPPVLPPIPVTIDTKKFPLPKRDKTTGLLSFIADDPEVKKLMKDFEPNRTPEEILRAGSFGGTYFRPITSAVTNISYNAQEVLKDTVASAWIKGLSMEMLTSKTYRPQINKYRVSCGGSLGMWESSGWIVESDPYGWFQWYCRFYQGRRSSDDARQISRWMKSAGPKGRFRSQLCNKILSANTKYDDICISPVIRQTLLHWGLEITPYVLDVHRKRVGR